MDQYSWNISAPEQVLSMLGSAVILLAYFLTVTRPDKKVLSFFISILGGVCLFIVAMIYHNVGFIFLETAWIAINVWGIWKASVSG